MKNPDPNYYHDITITITGPLASGKSVLMEHVIFPAMRIAGIMAIEDSSPKTGEHRIVINPTKRRATAPKDREGLSVKSDVDDTGEVAR